MALAAAVGAQASPLYSVTQVGTADQWSWTAQAAVNNLGQVAWNFTPDNATSLSQVSSFLYTPGVGLSALAPHFRATDINDAGIAAGALYVDDGQTHAATLNTRSGQLASLSGDAGSALWINNRGDVVGDRYEMVDGAVVVRPVLYRPDGSRVDVPTTVFPNERTLVSGLNDAGQMVLMTASGGLSHVAVGSVDGGFTRLADPPGASGMSPFRGLTDAGSFAGSLQTVDDLGRVSYHAALYHDGRFDALPELPFSEFSFGKAANDAGVVIGDGDQGAFYYSQRTGTVSLSSVVSSSCSFSNVEDISNSGYIVALGNCGGGVGRSLMLLTPLTPAVPEPAPTVLFAAGLTAVALRARRKG